MPGESISQIPLQANSISGAVDLLEISQYTGFPGQYITKKVLAGLLAAPQTFVTRGTFTLDAGVSSTVVPLTGCLPTSQFGGVPWPQTPHAANDLPTTSYTMGTNQFTVTHAVNSRVDRTFGFVLFF